MNKHIYFIFRRSLLLVLVLFPASAVRAQSAERPASELIKFLTYQSDRPGKEDLFITSCGKEISLGRENRQAANSLVKLGASAIPDIESALESIEARGRQSEFSINAEWLLFAYARIVGARAYLHFRRMIENPNLVFLHTRLDEAIALCFGLTSYISASRDATGRPPCRREEPRDALNQFMIGWLRNDPEKLEAALGPAALSALKSMLRQTSWAEMRTDLWHHRSGSGIAVGYLFDTPGRFSEPEETLEKEGNIPATLTDVRLHTTFTNPGGQYCGTFDVDLKQGADNGRWTGIYKINNSDIKSLLAIISSCAAN